jgi:hypothetical protein
MDEKPSLRSFAQAFREHWFAAMSGGFSVPFTALAVFFDNKYAKGIFAALAFLGAWFAAYSVWRVERQKNVDLQTMTLEIFQPEKVIQELVELQAEGKKTYNDTTHSITDYAANLLHWEAKVEQVLQANFSVSELHSFRNITFYNGAQYTLPSDVPKDWLEATEKQRILTSARIWALDHVIKYGSAQFFGPRLKLAEWLEDHQ